MPFRFLPLNKGLLRIAVLCSHSSLTGSPGHSGIGLILRRFVRVAFFLLIECTKQDSQDVQILLMKMAFARPVLGKTKRDRDRTKQNDN